MTKLPFNENIYRILLSAPVKTANYTRAEILSNGQIFQASLYTKTQVFHKNLQKDEVPAFVEEHLGNTFSQYTAWDGQREYSAKITKKVKMLTTSKPSQKPPELASNNFNRQKNHIIQEGAKIPALVEMGVFSKTYKIVMYDKFQQINRFLELLWDETKTLAPGTMINIIDFGCGKSYLTFLVYHYFVEIRGLEANICGLDLNEDVIKTCQAAAEKYGHKSLTFRLGDIGKQAAPPLEQWGKPGSFNIIISLHACDTATDHALANAVKWEADLICAVPCCQHELRNQMKPRNMQIFSEYGIIEERIASLATDAIRAKILEHMGYKAQIIEFTDMGHTPKNLLIRARRATANPKALGQVQKAIEEFGFRPTLMQLLGIY